MSDDRGLKDIMDRVHTFVSSEFVSDDGKDGLSDKTPLITAGIIDSIGTMRLITFLEQEFGISFAPGEVRVDRLNTLELIASTVQEKQKR